ncbi:hypothetical protein HELRODRAFT_112973 [Helobdella robusta]|uniref:FERM domain-containing protein n=1 Tax=Helobdella robusta TaxID=6412 RepID=T1EFN8_HELRO|nr:hypothetical protein HELRODRAFT_112973 [Helobdella robusta]ESO00828.1 hypothetical protein HELRODRAFT_112973 [Helobdella robusta]
MSQPASPSSNKKNLVCRVLMLDDSEELLYVPMKSHGSVLFNMVISKLKLLEADYFDLQYKNVEGIQCWLDHEKLITNQLPQNHLNFEFVVKFYTPDPGMLEEEHTRYLFALQVKRDLLSGRMQCQEQTTALLLSYIVQADYGDLTDEDLEMNPDYLRSVKLFENMSPSLESKIIQNHRAHFGQSPMDADYNLLDTARKVEFYGINITQCKDHESVPLHLAVIHMGIVVFQNATRINTFSWAKIRKLSFKRKKFLIKLHPEGFGFYKDTVEFYFNSRNECKNFWKKCLEHHAFFRCQSVKKIPRNKTRVVSHGSSFRYSGRTQKQLVDYVRENFVKRPNFQRSV